MKHAYLSFAIFAVACGGPSIDDTTPNDDVADNQIVAPPTPPRTPPPDSGPRRDVSFPPVTRSTLENGLEINVVEWHDLPIVYADLIVRSGGESDPENLQGLSSLVADMLKEGTRRKTSAQLAEAIDFLGADLWTSSDEENMSVGMRCLRDHFGTMMDLLGEVALTPRFDPRELDKLKRRELDRLTLQEDDPDFLAGRSFSEQLYGDHPYGRVDTTVDVVERVTGADLTNWHRTFVAPNNAVLVVVGDVTAADVTTAVTRAFPNWRSREVPAPAYATPPIRSSRSITVIDRPGSVQSVILIGNLAIQRSHDDYISLMVANQVLGGSATSRLFMDLRQQRSLTYGAYSSVADRVEVGAFAAQASVRTEKTAEAVGAFFEHLDRIVAEAPPTTELADAQSYLSDRFPLRIDTPGKIVNLVGDLRTFGLPDDYWDNFRSAISAVTPEQALAAAHRHIRPSEALIVVVGDASSIAEGLRAYGPVSVVSSEAAASDESTD